MDMLPELSETKLQSGKKKDQLIRQHSSPSKSLCFYLLYITKGQNIFIEYTQNTQNRTPWYIWRPEAMQTLASFCIRARIAQTFPSERFVPYLIPSLYLRLKFSVRITELACSKDESKTWGYVSLGIRSARACVYRGAVVNTFLASAPTDHPIQEGGIPSCICYIWLLKTCLI